MIELTRSPLADSLNNIPNFDTDPLWEIAHTGEYRNRHAVLGWCFGSRTLGWNSTSVMGDVASYLDTTQDALTPTVLGTSYYLVSSSAQDGVGGTGIRTMRVNCLVGAGGIRTIRTVTMNGTTPVLLGDDILFVNYMESDAIGSGGVAAGNITVSSRSTAGTPTVAQTIDKIPAGDGRSMAGRFMVPGDYHCHLIGWHAAAISNTMDVRCRATVFADDRSLSSGFHFQERVYLGSGANFTDDFHFLNMPPLSTLKFSAIPGAAAAGNRCDVGVHFILSKTDNP